MVIETNSSTVILLRPTLFSFTALCNFILQIKDTVKFQIVISLYRENGWKEKKNCNQTDTTHKSAEWKIKPQETHPDTPCVHCFIITISLTNRCESLPFLCRPACPVTSRFTATRLSARCARPRAALATQRSQRGSRMSRSDSNPPR